MKHINDMHLGFANHAQEGAHICLLYRDEKERRHVVSSFIKYGLKNNGVVTYFSDLMTMEELTKWLEEIEIDVSSILKTHQLNIYQALNVYCPHGVFEIDKILDKYKQFYADSLEKGFKGVHVSGETDWLNKKLPGTERFIEYEARLNETLLEYPIAVMCQYDARLFDGATIFDILQVHPLMVVQGQIVKNPAYIKPQEFLKKLNERESGK